MIFIIGLSVFIVCLVVGFFYPATRATEATNFDCKICWLCKLSFLIMGMGLIQLYYIIFISV